MKLVFANLVLKRRGAFKIWELYYSFAFFVFCDLKAIQIEIVVDNIILMQEINWIHNLLHEKILLVTRILSVYPLALKVLRERLSASFYLKNDELVIISIFKELVSMKGDNARSLANFHNSNLL